MKLIEKMITVYINDIKVNVEAGTTVLEAAKKVGIHIPTLCHLDLHDIGVVNKSANCRICVVEQENKNVLVPSCAEKVFEGMRIQTDSLKAVMGRRTSLELLLSNHPQDCLTCVKNLDCELQSLAHEMNIKEIRYQGEKMNHPKDNTSRGIIKDSNKCIMCRRCVTMCDDVQTVGVLSPLKRGFDVVVATAFHLDLADTSCTYCGQCISVCPTAALAEMDDSPKVWRALNKPNKHVIVQVAPAVRVAIGEEFGFAPGEISTGKIVTALKRMGFDSVFDTNFGADLTIVEEATELMHRIEHGGRLPMLTSCCPAWVKFIEHQFPELLDVPSSCKSPQQMVGSLIKTYYAESNNINPKDIISVSVMPCVAKKAEAAREELNEDGLMDVDFVITTRELARMLKEAAIDFKQLNDTPFDMLLGESTGAAAIFGTTGGVIEAATRTAYEMITGKELKEVNFKQMRGFEGIREATIDIEGTPLRIGIAHELGNARKLLESIRDGKSHFDVIEIMACPGGCIGGGGQPYHHGNIQTLKKRQEALYAIDKAAPRRKSHENEMVLKLYEEFLDKPGSPKAHKLLHTSYSAKPRI
ncbi:NADH-dependent [FeFe] hydrogenase, group A6 [Liberiplasma polymorphum]|uniref:NADH-dependent [FeFe] hydrogenase, group A6 n=1 Tax=Liberiplasma polymorphum TaxID=3374570 RepID=UPI003774843B